MKICPLWKKQLRIFLLKIKQRWIFLQRIYRSIFLYRRQRYPVLQKDVDLKGTGNLFTDIKNLLMVQTG